MMMMTRRRGWPPWRRHMMKLRQRMPRSNQASWTTTWSDSRYDIPKKKKLLFLSSYTHILIVCGGTYLLGMRVARCVAPHAALTSHFFFQRQRHQHPKQNANLNNYTSHQTTQAAAYRSLTNPSYISSNNSIKQNGEFEFPVIVIIIMLRRTSTSI